MSKPKTTTKPKEACADLGRRGFLKKLVGTAAAAALTTEAEAAGLSFEKFFQKHYRRMTDEDKRAVFARIERETKEDYGADVRVSDPRPIENVAFGYALNLSKCNGSRKCVTACQKENNQSRDPAISYIKVIELDRGSFDLEKGDMYYEGEVPKPGKVYMPVQCHQCDNPPCTKACPVQATWKEPDGVVVIDYDWCIGCRYCMVACPYEARSFNLADPVIDKHEINPNQSYLGNRIRPRGVVEKCHFCLQRTRNGDYPACLEACPTGARKFGNLNDPNSEVSQILATKDVYILKEELNTQPRFFYYFD